MPHMKRLVIALLLSTAPAHALDLAQTWKDISSYRVTSLAKAVIVGVGLGYVAEHAFDQANGPEGFTTVVQKPDGYKKGFGKAAIVAALGYAWFYGVVDHLWPYVKHGFAIK